MWAAIPDTNGPEFLLGQHRPAHYRIHWIFLFWASVPFCPVLLNLLPPLLCGVSVVTPWGTAFVTSFENFLLEFFRRLLLCRVPVSLLCGGVFVVRRLLLCRAAFIPRGETRL